MVQTKQGAGGSPWIQFIKEKSIEYHEKKSEQSSDNKEVQPNKKRRVIDGRADNRGAKTTSR